MSKKTTRILAMLLATIMVIGLMTGCGSKEEPTASTAPASGEVSSNNASGGQDVSGAATSMTFAVTSDPSSLWPYGSNRGGKQATRTLLYEPLFWLDAEGNLCPILAKSYENLGNGVYHVELFDYIVDSAGNPLKASDVVFSLGLFIEDGKQPAFVANLADYSAVDEYTVELVFTNERFGNFEQLVTNIYCITEAAWDASPDEMMTTPVGTGRYTLSEFEPAASYTFVKRDSYWQTDENYICAKNEALIDTLILKIVTDTSTIAVSLEKGAIDYTQNIETPDRPNFMNDDGTAKDGYITQSLPTTCFIHLTFNCSTSSPCSDINLRRAIATCIDSAAVAQNIQGSNGRALNSAMVDTLLDADPSLYAKDDYFSYSAEQAKEYLEQSSYAGQTLKILVQPNTNTTDSATLIMAYCNAIGINIELLNYESALYTEMSNSVDPSQYDMVLTGLSSSDGYAWKNLFEMDINSYDGKVNNLFIYDETLQTLYDAAASAETGGKEASAALANYIDEQCYMYSLYTYDLIYVGRDSISQIAIGSGNAESIYNAFVLAD